jgi:hypothetical protein
VNRWLRAGLLAGLLATAPPLAAHAIHTSVAEADYNAATRRLEVSLRVFIDDFEAALSVHARRRLSLAGTPREEFDAAARTYLAETFTVRSPDGQLAPLLWVGREVRDAENELWFHFEVALPGGIEGCRVHHRALGEQFPTQINSVRVRDGERRVTLVFLARQTEKTVRFRP